MNPTEVTAYFASSEYILKKGWMDNGIPLYLFCGTFAGINGLMFGNPLDVIRTVQLTSKKTDLTVLQTISLIYKSKGPLGFY